MMTELETIAKARVVAGEVCSLASHYNPKLKEGGPGAPIAVLLKDRDSKILKAIRGRQGPGALILLREKPE